MILFNSIKNLKMFLYKQKKMQADIKKQTLELVWAHVYHDSIRGKEFLEKLPLNIGRWAGNYTFFYILSRALMEYRPLKIIEFGLGESTKMISAYMENELLDSQHLVIEQNEDWLNNFLTRFRLSERTTVEILPQIKVDYEGEFINAYKGIEKFTKNKYDLFVIDGPLKSEVISRIDIFGFLENAEHSDQFIIILDDCQRKGEQRTFEAICEILNDKDIIYTKNKFRGNKTVGVIATEEYKWITSI
jgi:hypothetical protein